MRWTITLVSIAAVGFAAGGCASSGDLEALSERVAALEAQTQNDAQRIAVLESRMDDELAALQAEVAAVSASAGQSVEQATEAAERARAAETQAGDAARKADAIFKKSVSK